MMTRSDVEFAATCRPRTSAQNRDTAGASAQSIAMAASELLISVFPVTNGRRLCGRPEGLARTVRGAHVPEGMAAGIRRRSRRAPGSDGGAAAVSGDDRAGDVAGLRGDEQGDDPGALAGLLAPGQPARGAACRQS